MSAEELFNVNTSSKRYRSDDNKFRDSLDMVIDKRKVELVDFNDGEACLVKHFSGIDSQNYEEILVESNKELKEDVNTLTLGTDYIYYDADDNSYSLYHNMGNKIHFKKLCSMRPTGKTQLLRKIEELTRAILKPSQPDLSVEISGFNPQTVIQAQILLFDEFNTPSEIRPYSYDVIDQTTRRKLQTVDLTSFPPLEESKDTEQSYIPKDSIDLQDSKKLSQPEEKFELNEYPVLKLTYSHRQQGFLTYVHHFPKVCTHLLLNDRAKLLKQLTNEMNTTVEYFINKQRKSLEILGYTEQDVIDGYAAFIRVLRSHPKAAKAFLDAQNGKRKVRYTHFLAVSFLNNSDISAVQRALLDERISNLIPEMGIPENQFHITVGLLSLDQTQGIIQALEEFKSQLKSIVNQPLQITFSKANCFGAAKNAHVLYLEPEKDEEYFKLNELSYQLIKYLHDRGFITEDILKDKQISIENPNFTYAHHLTLAKTSRISYKKNGPKLDASEVLPRYSNLTILAMTDSLELLSMKKDSNGDPYKLVHRIEFSS